MLLLLQHRRADGDLDTYHLKPGRDYVIGRGSDCEVRILDLKLSRRHACLTWQERCWILDDLGSTNGCAVDGVLVEGSVVLEVGSTITLGSSTLVVARLVDPALEPPTDMATLPGGGQEILLEATNTPMGVPALPEILRVPIDDLGPVEEIAVSPQETPLPIGDCLAIGQNGPKARPIARDVPATGEEIPGKRHSDSPILVQSGIASQALSEAVTQREVRRPTSTPTPTPALAADQDRTFTITVLGRTLGPLTREQARDLRTRELTGTLRIEDLAGLPQVSAATR